MDEHKNKIEEVKIIPSTGGVFEVYANDKLVFSKKSLGRFPEDDEVENSIRIDM